MTGTLYAFFGSVGAVLQVSALYGAVALTFASRHLPRFRLAIAGASLLALSLVLWGAWVAPVNAE